MSQLDKTKPDVLRVTEYILEQAKSNTSFSVINAAQSKELNGVNEYRIAEIMRDICLAPNGPNSLIEYTTVDGHNSHGNSARWQLNTSTYFSYLSHLSLLRTEESIELTKQSLTISELSNKTANKTLWIAIATMVISLIIPAIPVITSVLRSYGYVQ